MPQRGKTPDFRQGYGDELHMLADLKRDLFPWQFDNVMHAGLEPGLGPDTLVADTGGAVERIELARCPSITALPRITQVLVQMHKDTKAQRSKLEEARKTPGLIGQVATRDMLTTWSEASPEPAMRSGIGRFLLAVDEIEDDTKAVPGILAVALGAP